MTEQKEFIDYIDYVTNDEKVFHPKHYTSHPSGVEAIDIARHMSFNLGNAIKYIFRCGLKDSESDIVDLKKAIFYIWDEIQRLENFKLQKSGE